MSWLDNKRITITGGAGFLGTHLVDRLKETGCQSIFVPRSKDYDLTDNEAVKRLYHDSKPNIVIHLASVVGGIGFKWRIPGVLGWLNDAVGN